MIYFTSDLHFYHDRLMLHVNRPFHNFEEMNKKLIYNWNKKVDALDELYVLGDATLKGPNYAMQILRQLNGKIYLIKGNHDQFVEKKALIKISLYG